MMQPKRTKFRKQQKGRNRGLAQRGSKVSFGEFGLKATDRGRLTARQIEAARRAMTRHVKRGGKIWIRVFPDKPITQNLWKFVKVRVRVTLNIGYAKFNRAKSYMKWKVFQRKWRVKRLPLPLQNSQLQQHLLDGR